MPRSAVSGRQGLFHDRGVFDFAWEEERIEAMKFLYLICGLLMLGGLLALVAPRPATAAAGDSYEALRLQREEVKALESIAAKLEKINDTLRDGARGCR